MGVTGTAEVGEWLTVDQAARELQVSDKTIRRWVAAGELPATRHGRTIRIRRTDLVRRPGDGGASAVPADAAAGPRLAAVANLKGGVGKTTTVFALGDALAGRGYRVLMLDLDPQSSLSIASGVNLRQAEREGRTSTDLLEGFVRRNEVLGAAALSYQVAERLDLIVTTLALHRTEALVREATAEELVLRRWFAAQTLDYDVVLIDSAPAKSPLTMNALCAAHSVIVPVQPEFLAVQGLAYLFETIREVQLHGLNPNLQVDGVLITMTETRTVHAREMHEDVVAFLSRRNEETPVLGEIRRSIRVAEAVSHRQPITRFAPQSDQAQTYERIAARLARRWRLEAPAVAAASR